jgi:hypothetical protein
MVRKYVDFTVGCGYDHMIDFLGINRGIRGDNFESKGHRV